MSEAKPEGRLLQSIVESSDDAIFSKDLDGIVTSWNAAAQRMYGYSAVEMIGADVRLIVPDERDSEVSGIIQKIRRGEKLAHFTTERVTKDGRRIQVSLSVSPVRDHDGTIIGASVIAHELTGDEMRLEEMRQLVYAATSRARSVDKLAALVRKYNTNVEKLYASLAGLATSDDLERRVERSERKITRRTVIGALIIVLAVFGVTRVYAVQGCQQRNDTRGVIVGLLNQQSGASLEAPPGSPPELVEVLAKAKEQNDAFRKDTLQRLQPEGCEWWPWWPNS